MDSAAPLADVEFEVVFICTGNRARSPFSAEVFRRYAGDLPVAVTSVGTMDLGPAPALRDAVWAARLLQVDLSEHRARLLEPGALESADLAVGFEPFHVAAAVIEGGAARERVFLITELAELLGQIGAARDRRPERTIEIAHARRASLSSAAPVGDPVGRSKQEFQRTFEQIERLVAAIAAGLFGDRRVDSSVR
jgi:protein-tyrosine-phosphatase